MKPEEQDWKKPLRKFSTAVVATFSGMGSLVAASNQKISQLDLRAVRYLILTPFFAFKKNVGHFQCFSLYLADLVISPS